jgi:hypothetical protein
MRELRSRLSVDDEADVADLKFIEELGATTSAPQLVAPPFTDSHTYGGYDDLRNPQSSRDCGSRCLWMRFRNSASRRRAAVV